jgi:hypothetical protein
VRIEGRSYFSDAAASVERRRTARALQASEQALERSEARVPHLLRQVKVLASRIVPARYNSGTPKSW